MNINLLPFRAVSLSLRLQGRGPKSSFDAKDDSRKKNPKFSWASNLLRTISHRATRFATKAAEMHFDAFSEVCAANPITLFSQLKVSSELVKFFVAWTIASASSEEWD